jgi:hypothetical protein
MTRTSMGSSQTAAGFIATWLAGLAAAVTVASCTTSETGSIELSPSAPMPAAMKPPKAPKMPMPCAEDMDCPKPMPHCDLGSSACVACKGDVDCGAGGTPAMVPPAPEPPMK